MTPESKSAVRSILHATDFSENANTAMKWAIMLAKAHRAPLSVLHVAHVTSVGSLSLGVQEQITRSVESAVAAVMDAGVEATGQWRAGKPWEVISDEARKHDLVVIGARGHTAILKFPIGSTADRVLRTAPAPVLTIHAGENSDAHVARNVIVPTDFSETASRALDAVVRILSVPTDDKLNITLVHAWQPLVQYDEPYAVVAPPGPYTGTEQQAWELLKRQAAKSAAAGVNVTPVLRPGYPTKVIGEVADAINAELIAMGTHGHSGLARFMLGSVAERVLHRVRCPVLTVNGEVTDSVKHVRTSGAVAEPQSF